MAKKPTAPVEPGSAVVTADKVVRCRLPYPAEVEQQFGIDIGQWSVLCDALFPNVRNPNSIRLYLNYCKSRKLDVFKRPAHIVPMYDAKANNGEGGYVDTIWPSITELRTTAFRTGQYAGCDEAVFGPMMETKFKGQAYRDGKRSEITKVVKHPEWCQYTVYRLLHGQRMKFAGPKVYWLEAYARMGRSELPNDMWEKRVIGQVDKVAEASALRRAFPEEIGHEYAAEEMEGQRIMTIDEPRDIAPSVQSESTEGAAEIVPQAGAPTAALAPPPPPGASPLGSNAAIPPPPPA